MTARSPPPSTRTVNPSNYERRRLMAKQKHDIGYQKALRRKLEKERRAGTRTFATHRPWKA